MLRHFIRYNRRSKKLCYRSIETGFLQVLRKFFRYFGCFQKGLFNIAASHMLLLITVMPTSNRDNVCFWSRCSPRADFCHPPLQRVPERGQTGAPRSLRTGSLGAKERGGG